MKPFANNAVPKYNSVAPIPIEERPTPEPTRGKPNELGMTGANFFAVQSGVLMS